MTEAQKELEHPARGRMQGSEFVYPLRVYYEDTDAAGLIYYANYLRYLERARTEMLRHYGYEHQAMMTGVPEDHRLFAVRRCDIEYLTPARLDDVVHVHSHVVSMRAAAVDLAQEVRRGDDVLARATVTAVCIDGTGRPRRLPGNLRHILAEIVD